LSCSPPKPITVDRSSDFCSWEQGGGGPGRSAFVNVPAADQPRLLWKTEFKSGLNIEPTATLGVIIIPAPDKKLHIISANNGAGFAEIKFRETIITPAVLADSIAVINLGGDRIMVENWVTQEEKWEAELTGSAVEPLIFNNMLYWVDGPGYLRCFDLAEGRRIWDGKIQKAIGIPPLACSLGVVIIPEDGIIECFDPYTGTRIWSLFTQERFKSNPLIIDDHLLVASVDGQVMQVRMKDGNIVWQRDLRLPIWAPLASDGEGVFIGTNNRFIMRLDFNTGDVDWEKELGGPIKAGPAVTGNSVIYVSLDHKAYFVDKISGEIRFIYEADLTACLPPGRWSAGIKPLLRQRIKIFIASGFPGMNKYGC
jgi:outer membrane protein assembly factor BamB